MLRPEYLENIPDSMVELYSQAEADIIRDMCRRISTYNYWIPSAEWQYKKATEMGMLHDDILKRMSSISGISTKELERLMKQAGAKAIKADDAIYREAGLNPKPLNASAELLAVLAAGMQRTNKVFKNLSGTTAKAGSRQLELALDRAYLQVTTGAFDTNTAVRSAVKELCKNGLAMLEYPSGRMDYIETVVRRAVVTGVNQTCGQMQETRADEVGSDLVETTAHSGARPDHAKWQGKVFSRSGKSDKYPDFVSSTGYGSVTGLCGANCRHSFYPFFEGISEKAYSTADLKSMDAKNYTYNGQKMTEYEAVGKQRYIERQIRRWKREEGGMEAAGLAVDEAKSKVAYWQSVQRDFLKQTGLKRQYDREQIGKSVVKPTEKRIIKSIDIDDFQMVTSSKNISDDVSRTIYNTIKPYERNGDFYISDVVAKSIPRDGNGVPVFQTEPLRNGNIILNINTDILAGKTVSEIDDIFVKSSNSLANSLEEAIEHECVHAKMIRGLNTKEIKDLYDELDKIHIDGISRTAYLDGAECIAEVGILIKRGEKVPSKAMELYQKYMRGR